MEEIIKEIEAGTAGTEAIEKTLALPEERLASLIEAVGAIKSERAAMFLALLYPSLSDKKLQKLVKKQLFRLKTQGVPIEEPRPSGESVLKRVETTREARAFLSNYDDEQRRVVLVAVEMKKHLFLFTHAISRFSEGLIELKSVPTPREELDDLLAGYAARIIRPMVLQPISAPYAGYLIEEASGISGKESEEARTLRRMLSAAKGDVKTPRDIYLLKAEDASRVPAEAVFTSDIFGPFSLSWPGIEEDLKKLGEAVNPGIVLPPYVVEERRQAFLDDLTGSERLKPSLSPFKRMLEDYAYLFHTLGEYDRYRALVEELKEEAAVKKAFLAFVRKSFEGLEKTKEEKQLPGLIVDPYSLKKK